MLVLDQPPGRTEDAPSNFADSGEREAALARIAARQATVAIVGLGYVGLPLAVAFAEAGFHTIGIDIDAKRVADINAGQSPVSDVPSERLAALVTPPAVGAKRRTDLRRRVRVTPDQSRPSDLGQLAVLSDLDALAQPGSANGDLNHNGAYRNDSNGHHATVGQRATPAAHGRLSATADFDVLADADAVIICVPTPLNRAKDPDVSYIIAVTDQIARRLHPGMLVVLESTTYPGTTEELVLPRLERAFGASVNGKTPGADATRLNLEVGRDFFLAFSPERIDPGRHDWNVQNTPKVIGGVTPVCLAVATALYSSAIERIVPVSAPKAAEMVKLLENTFRAVNIALVNEVAIMCDHLGINVWEVIDAAATKPFGFMPFYPGPGLGGHCIPIDPQYLAWKLKTLDYNARFIQLAAEINFGMPHHVLGKITDALNTEGKSVNGSRVLVLGVAYKANVGDLRESPALDVIRLLAEKGARLSYHDPYVPRLETPGLRASTATLDQVTLAEADCVVITTAHDAYNWEWIARHSRLIVDTRNALRDVATSGAKVVRL